MSLYGALFSGVASLNAQSTKLSILSDNIANVNTVGYKGGSALFQSLVTGASGSTSYSPGGVIGGNRQTVQQQGLLQSTSSPTDIAIQGNGLFVVNQTANGTGQVLYTRAGSFTQDSSGNFQNAAGFFLQAWPLDSSGALPGAPGNADTTSSANLTSLQTVNVQNLTGAASATTNVSLAANLDAGATAYPGASVTAAMDTQNAPNFGITANSIIVPSPPGTVDNLTYGDTFNVTTGANAVNFNYGGYTYSRSVANGAGAASGQAVPLGTPATLGTTVEALGAATVSTIGGGDDHVTITSNGHGLNVGDWVTLAGAPAGGIGGITAVQLTGTFQVSSVGSANQYTLLIPGASTTGIANNGATAMTATVNPFTTTALSPTVTVFQPANGLKTGDVVSIAGDGATIGGNITPTDLTGSFVVTVVDANHYTITAPVNAASSGGGGTGTVTMRPFAGNILDAQTATQPFLATTGTSGFTAAGLTFTITSGNVTSSFTYTASSPNAQLGQFNTLTNLATAISDVNGLSARVVSNQLYVSATDASNALTFANGSTTGVSGPPVQAGIDWVDELGLVNIGTGANRFSTLQGLADLVNASSGLVATLNNPLGASSLNIGITNPLNTMTLNDRPTAVPLSSWTGATYTTTAGSNLVTITTPPGINLPSAPHNFNVGDTIVMNGGGLPATVNGIPRADFSGSFIITAVSGNTFTVALTAAGVAAAATTTNGFSADGLIVTPPNNTGSVLAALGLVASGTTPPASTIPIGPAYAAEDSAKNMASGAITPQFSRPVTVYDSLGTAHNLNIAFIKTASNAWAIEVFAQPAADVNSPFPNGQVTYGNITFNGDGSLQSVTMLPPPPVSINWTDGALPSTIAFNWGTAGQPFGTPNATSIGKTDGLEQFNSAYNVASANQNGSAVGSLTAVSIDATGFITASFSNGETKNLYQIPLASFTSPDNLTASSGNVYAQSSASGQVALVQAGTNPVGAIASSSLEASNVELATQLTDMIVAQSAYQASTKVIATANTLLGDLNQIIQ